MKRLCMTLLCCALGAGAAAAQEAASPPAAKGKGAPGRAPGEELRLVFEREVYTYPGSAGRRDPFRPLTGRNDVGPMFSELKLRSILYVSSEPARSIATVVDGSNKTHRMRRGDTVGNATVLDVGQYRVLFSVEDFGVRRQEVLEMKATTGRGRTR